MVIREDRADVTYKVASNQRRGEPLQTMRTSYRGEVGMYPSYVHLVDQDKYIPLSKVFSIDVLEE